MIAHRNGMQFRSQVPISGAAMAIEYGRCGDAAFQQPTSHRIQSVSYRSRVPSDLLPILSMAGRHDGSAAARPTTAPEAFRHSVRVAEVHSGEAVSGEVGDGFDLRPEVHEVDGRRRGRIEVGCGRPGMERHEAFDVIDSHIETERAGDDSEDGCIGADAKREREGRRRDDQGIARLSA